MGDFTKDTIRGVNNLRKVCKERVWEECKRITTKMTLGSLLFIVCFLFIITSAFSMVFKYLGNVMLPSRKEKGGA